MTALEGSSELCHRQKALASLALKTNLASPGGSGRAVLTLLLLSTRVGSAADSPQVFLATT